MSFKDPWILISIPFFIIILSLFFIEGYLRAPAFRFSSFSLFSNIKSSWKIKLFKFLPFLRIAILSLFLFALAGPRKVLEHTEILSEGIDIILAVDASGSMAAEDFELEGNRVNRLDIVKNVVQDFIKGRKNDRIGLVVFAGQAYTICPLTTDYDWLISNLERVELDLLKDEGTAVGSAISSSLGRLRRSKAKSKVVILLTDGVSNAGNIDPIKAAEAAKALGIKIYTIGAGSKGLVPFPMKDFFGREVYRKVQIDLDEDTLKEIALMTKGLYFRATNTEALRNVYKEIDILETTEIEEKGYQEYKQLFVPVLLLALGLLLIEILLKTTLLMKVP